MTNKRIIIAEDDISTNVMLYEFLSSKGFNVETGKDGSEALEKYKENPSQIVITDIEMPGMNGNELIGHLNAFEIPPIIFVTTSHSDHELIINIMKQGVYDYIIKPVDMNDLLLKITRAFDAYDMKRAFEITQREKVIRLENNLEWYKFEEKIKSRDSNAIGTNIFESLLTSFNQGSGFGSLITFISLMRSTAVKDGDYYKISNKLYDTIMENVKSADKALQAFADMTKIVADTFNTERISISSLYDYVAGKLEDLESQIAIGKHHLMLSDRKKFFSNQYIEINRDYIMKAFEEIILNSLKFSPEGSDVMVLLNSQNERCAISVINDVVINDKGHKGIPVGYENLVFEPFYRLTKTVREKYKTLDYGLGLTLVEKIIIKCGGTIAINNIMDYSDIKSGPKVRVECTMIFPVSHDEIRKSSAI